MWPLECAATRSIVIARKNFSTYLVYISDVVYQCMCKPLVLLVLLASVCGALSTMRHVTKYTDLCHTFQFSISPALYLSSELLGIANILE